MFYKPLREVTLLPDPWISKDELNAIFANTETLMSINDVLLQQLSERVNRWHSVQLLADVFNNLVLGHCIIPYSTDYANRYRY